MTRWIRPTPRPAYMHGRRRWVDFPGYDAPGLRTVWMMCVDRWPGQNTWFELTP